MWPWSSGSDKPPAQAKPSPAETKPAQDAATNAKSQDFDSKKLQDREKLSPRLRKIVDRPDKDDFLDDLYEGYAPPSTESKVRYAAYAARFRTILMSAHRYVAYTSDIGESFRPVAHPRLVRAAYGISWAYILGDVSYEGYKAYWQNQRILNPQIQLTPWQQRILGINDATGSAALPAHTNVKPGKISPLEDYRTVMLQRAIFQSIASMGLPALTIHSVVRYSGRAMKDVKNKTIRTWGPIGLGLAVVPFLPALFDKPVENAVEWAFHKAFESYGGREAVGEAPLIGREKQLSERPKEKKL